MQQRYEEFTIPLIGDDALNTIGKVVITGQSGLGFGKPVSTYTVVVR